MPAIDRVSVLPGACRAEPIDIRPHQLRSIIRRREARNRYFPLQLFGDMGWDILLDLALARMTGEMPELRAARSQPPATIERWLGALADEGMVIGGGVDVRLSDSGLYAVNAWLSDAAAR